ncbi:hypothetical protein QKU48_gp1045 [Fadolivirus algeromassiliense]|jgi:glucan phosphoethanolaminetransferase (alkaline phosphatase superfamily)|uniref:Uncharacterized protein n=1 Tax=Fadolivirus FV1/VV64 TaxID=3070911 RepID=A0A7D3QUX1_9VIRU|nr:hypothetical protein QKU48_gp1045 [Fadolivirus algeromassiliense]QKF94503.1 hypothetical protein Fadolivirus_1_1045 [Fadolivirus FV1/VV64]
MDIKQLYNFLGTKDALVKIALLTGFVQTLRCSDFLENPLSAVCCGIIIATIYAFVAEFVISLAPEFLRPIISLVLIMSIVYYIFIKRECQPIVKVEQDATYMRLERVQ